jgi:hypothetical protein
MKVEDVLDFLVDQRAADVTPGYISGWRGPSPRMKG